MGERSGGGGSSGRETRSAGRIDRRAFARGLVAAGASLAVGCNRGRRATVSDEALAPYRAAHLDWRGATGAKLVLAMNQHMETDALRAQLATFTALTGVEARIESYPENELHDKTLVDLSSRQGGFDVVMMDFMFTPQYARAKLIQPLDAYLADASATDAAFFAVDDFVPALLDAARFEQALWAVPFTSESTL